MKTIGLIGGMSWESTKVYYEYLNTMVNNQKGGSHSAKILMSSVDFAEIEKDSLDDNWKNIGKTMGQHAKKLEQAGADVIILCTNTIHLVSDAITASIQVPFLHIADATGNAIAHKKLKKVGLLGTSFTMERDFYTKTLREKYGLDVVVPKADDRQQLQHIIYNELVKGSFTKNSKLACLRMIQELIGQQGVEGIILGCTELPILIPETEIPVQAFNTTKLHAQKAVEFALS